MLDLRHSTIPEIDLSTLGANSIGAFQSLVVEKGQPVVMRGLCADWPIVHMARQSNDQICAYLMANAGPAKLATTFGAPAIKRRLFYNQDMTGFNFQVSNASLAEVFDYILSHCGTESPPTVAVQSIEIAKFFPSLLPTLKMPLLAATVLPRIWLGGPTIVAPHYDPSDNIAVCVAGRRTFTLFPPEQAKNLYVGPMEITPAGAPVSLVDLAKPDIERFPRFEAAAKVALYADLEPGDAIFVPYLWWHHVEAHATFNALVNYWWTSPKQVTDPTIALRHLILAVGQLPHHQKQAWRDMLDFYVFGDPASSRAHIPTDRRGILAEISPSDARTQKERLIQALSQRH